ncbi:hypothetical protein FOL47_008199 [Perkinsus chesapeaki]|uniref:Uncharacterized protein n=1 Tax=Perkinsus chesapeaki TaxID=330153 RepID=A0A7J6LFN6_PERCH|nr:hypothetical protein FOL47_008199 [Perkinsus chesapeaki]
MPNTSYFNRLLSMVALQCLLWSIECQTGSYSGYTDKEKQCIQSDWLDEPTTIIDEQEVRKVVLLVSCKGRAAGSPYLEFVKPFPGYPYTLRKSSEGDHAEFMKRVYHTCNLVPSPSSHNDLRTFYASPDYTKFRVDFHDEVVYLTEGEC